MKKHETFLSSALLRSGPHGGQPNFKSLGWSDELSYPSGQVTAVRAWYSSKREASLTQRHGAESGKQIKYDLKPGTKIIKAQVRH